jgi:Probable N6-adenine methyltransferase
MHQRKTTSRLSSERAEGDAQAVPCCLHGPAILFDRALANGSKRSFYACSAVRDRKECPLFYWLDDWVRLSKKRAQAEPAPVRRKLTESNGLGESSFLANAESLSASQFFFDKVTLGRVVDIINSLSPKNILCIGCPTISMRFDNSTLLDIDERLPGVKRFNMFTGHFFNPEDEAAVCSQSFDLVVCDPPFQPELLPLLAATVHKLAPAAPLLLAFPCFNRDAVSVAFSAKMTDLRLGYENHRNFKNEKSPVRLFTTIPLHRLILPGDDYKLCEPCGRYVHEKLNRHCSKCNSCTTIHGGAVYQHCKACERCVKPGYKHCANCRRCFPVDHQCRKL